MENRDDPSAMQEETTETLVGDDGRRAKRGVLIPGDKAPQGHADALPDVLGLLGEHTPVPISLETTRVVAEVIDPSLTSMSLPPPPPTAAITYPAPPTQASSMRVVRRRIRKLGGGEPESDRVEAAPPDARPLEDDDAATNPKLPRLSASPDELRAAAKGSPLIVAVSRTPVPPVARPVSLDLIKPTPIPSPPVPKIQAILADDFSVPEVDATSEALSDDAPTGEYAAATEPATESTPAPPVEATAVPLREPPPRKPPSIPPSGVKPVVIAAPAGLRSAERPPLAPEPAALEAPPRLSEPELSAELDGVEVQLDVAEDEVERLSLPDGLAEREDAAQAGRGLSLPPPPPGHAIAATKPPGARTPAVTVVDAKRKRRYWWEELFSDDYFRTLPRMEREQVRAEADWIEHALGTELGASILDLACGSGHHATELALRRYEITGLDLSSAMLSRAAETANGLGAEVKWVQADMVHMDFVDAFDAAYCVGTSFGLFDDERNTEVARRLHRALKPNGTFLLQVLNRDHVIQRQPAMAWFEGDGCVCMEETSFNFITSRLNVKRTMIFDDGRQREIEYSIRIYSLHELGQVLHQAGFRILEVSGHPRTPGAFFGASSRELIILAQKRGSEVIDIPAPADSTPPRSSAPE